MLSFVQLPLFWHGSSMSHGSDGVPQFVPIVFWPGQIGGKKAEDDAAANQERNI